MVGKSRRGDTSSIRVGDAPGGTPIGHPVAVFSIQYFQEYSFLEVFNSHFSGSKKIEHDQDVHYARPKEVFLKTSTHTYEQPQIYMRSGLTLATVTSCFSSLAL